MQSIMHAFTDDDMYKFSQQQLAFNQFPNAVVTYEYINRSGYKFPLGFGDLLKNQIQLFSDFRLSDSEYDFMSREMPWLKKSYLLWLKEFKLNPSHVLINQDGDNLEIKVHGPWRETILWEVRLLYTISQLRFTNRDTGKSLDIEQSDWKNKIDHKRDLFFSNDINWIDFGTRRRFSFEVQDEVVKRMKMATPNFRGTSNVFLAMKHNVKPNGTIAHETFMAMQSAYGLELSDKMALEHWVKEYNGNIGIALMDTLSSKKFLKKDFDFYYANLFDGVRQDSGDPFETGEMVIQHYKQLGIDPTSKVIIFSDNLSPEKVLSLSKRFNGRIRTIYGIGTNLTCDVGIDPMNHVIKMTKADFGKGEVHLTKLSDDRSKITGNAESIANALKMVSST